MLDARTNQAVDAHLASCAACRHELDTLNSVVSLVEEYGVRQPPAGLFNAVRNRIESGEMVRDRPAWWAWFYSRPARGLAMGAAMAAVALGLVLPVSGPTISRLDPHPTGPSVGGSVASSIGEHLQSVGEGPLTDRVAYEALVQLNNQEEENRQRRGVQ